MADRGGGGSGPPYCHTFDLCKHVSKDLQRSEVKDWNQAGSDYVSHAALETSGETEYEVGRRGKEKRDVILPYADAHLQIY